MIRLFSIALLVSSLFPFVTLVRFGFDSQPYACIFAIFLIATVSIKKPIYLTPHFYGFLLTFVLALFTLVHNLFIYSNFDWFTSFRSMFTLLSIPICVIAFLNAKLTPEDIFIYLKRTILIYGIVGLVQFFYRGFLSFLIARSSTSGERGVYSLTVEPVEYSRMCLFLFIMLALFKMYRYCNNKTFLRYTLLLLFQAVVLSLSGTGFSWVAVMLVIYLLTNSSISKGKLLAVFVGCVILISGIAYLGIMFFPEKRVFFLLSLAFENPEQLSQFAGFVLRTLNPIHSFLVGIIMFKGCGVGLGFPGSTETVDYSFLGPMFKDTVIDLSGRSHGGLSSLIYELGILSIPYILYIFSILFKNYNFSNHNVNAKFLIYSFLLLILFDGPISSAILGLIIALFYILPKKQKFENNILYTT